MFLFCVWCGEPALVMLGLHRLPACGRCSGDDSEARRNERRLSPRCPRCGKSLTRVPEKGGYPPAPFPLVFWNCEDFACGATLTTTRDGLPMQEWWEDIVEPVPPKPIDTDSDCRWYRYDELVEISLSEKSQDESKQIFSKTIRNLPPEAWNIKHLTMKYLSYAGAGCIVLPSGWARVICDRLALDGIHAFLRQLTGK